MFLREGCLLRYADEKDVWTTVPRRGKPSEVSDFPSRVHLVEFAKKAAAPFKERWPKDGKEQALPLEHKFSIAEAKKLLAKKGEETTP
jgi:CRISPR-associated protein Csb1